MAPIGSVVGRQAESFRIYLDAVRSPNPYTPSEGLLVHDIEEMPVGGEVLLKLADVSLPDSDESWKGTWGEELLERAKRCGTPAGRRCAGVMLARQREIPVSWREFFLLLAGSAWEDADADERRFILCFAWRSGRWWIGYVWLHESFPDHFRLVLVV